MCDTSKRVEMKRCGGKTGDNVIEEFRHDDISLLLAFQTDCRCYDHHNNLVRAQG